MRGVLLDLGDYPAVYVSDNGAIVGELYRIEAALLATLDDFEECSVAFPEPHEYRRALCPVVTASGPTLDAWVYLYNRAPEAHAVIASGDWLQR